MGSKVLERNVCVSNSEIKAEKERPDHEVREKAKTDFPHFDNDWNTLPLQAQKTQVITYVDPNQTH